MKALKSILIFSLCILAVSSCKKNDDDWGGNDMNDIPSGKVALDSLGMRAFFPEGKWGKEGRNDFLYEPGFERECIFTYLKESIVEGNATIYISFMRFVDSIDEEKANAKIQDYKNICEGYENWVVSEIIPTEINGYLASKIECIRDGSATDESYFIYHKNRLYQIELLIPNDKINRHYRACEEIIKTLKLTD
jgi:hypothetical protein